MINGRLDQGLGGEALLEAAVTQVQELNGGELTDDVAVLLLERNEARTRGKGGSASRSRPGAASSAGAQRPPL
jgi:hypothetical protein